MIDEAGKYKDELEKLQETTDADAILMMVVNGNRGHGMAIRVNSFDDALKISLALTQVAKKIFKDAMKAAVNGGFADETQDRKDAH